MWPLGHAAVAYLLVSYGGEWGWLPRPDFALVATVLFASQTPDLIDKPLAWYLPVLPAGRSLGHSLFLLLPVCLLAVAIGRRRGWPALGLAVTLGLLSHVALDVTPALWGGEGWRFLVWPIRSIDGFDTAPSILAMLEANLDDPWFQLEFVLAGLALVRWRGDGYPGLAWLRADDDRALLSGSERRGD